MGSHARVTGASVKDSNDKPPYRHWHAVCAACGKVTLARPCKVPGDIDPVEHKILRLIVAARHRAFHAVNTELIDLYWQVGGIISRKIEAAEWGDGVVDRLA